MLQPVELKDFFITFFASGIIIVSGALYALFYAFYHLKKIAVLNYLAYVSYFVLFISVLIITQTMHLDKIWTIVVIAMLVGYFLAPRGIWHLCVATHKEKGYEQK